MRNGDGSTLTPGLMVAARVMASTNEPLAVAGLALTTASMTALPFCINASSAKENFPTGTATLRVLIELKFHASGLDFLDGLGGVVGDRSGFRIRHEAAGTKNFSKFFYLRHGGWGSDGHIEIRKAAGDLLDQIFESYKFRARVPGGIRGGPRGEDQNANRLSAAMRKRAGAAHHLIALLGINSQLEGQA